VTANGKTLGENIAGAKVFNDDVIRTRDNPIIASDTLAVLYGNLAPDGAVIKPPAADPKLLQHSGPAVVFENYNDMAARIDDPDLVVDENSVLVLQNAGPQGAPGQIMLVSCTTAKKKVKGQRVTRRKCTTRLISGVATFTTTPTAARLTRGRVVYAAGSAWLYYVTLDASRRITPGRYTLTLRRGGTTTRQAVVVS